MKQIEFETHVKAGNVAEVVVDMLHEKWFVIVHLKSGSPAALHTARGEVRYWANMDPLRRFVGSECGWRGDLRVKGINDSDTKGDSP